MNTQAFVFIGEGHYPLRFLEDLFTTLPYAPTLSQLAAMAKQRIEQDEVSEQYRQVDWAAVLVVHDNAPPEQLYFQFWEKSSKEELDAAGFTEAFEFSRLKGDEQGWLGVRELERTTQNAAHGHTYKPK
jgi:hypothetical protein